MLLYNRSIREGAEARKGKKMDTIKNKLGAEMSWEWGFKHMDKKILDDIRFDLSLQEIYKLYCFLHKEKYGDEFYLEKLVRNKNGAMIEIDSFYEEMSIDYKRQLDNFIILFSLDISFQKYYEMYCYFYKKTEHEEFILEKIERSWFES